MKAAPEVLPREEMKAVTQAEYIKVIHITYR